MLGSVYILMIYVMGLTRGCTGGILGLLRWDLNECNKRIYVF